jgi:hypothetical protein
MIVDRNLDFPKFIAYANQDILERYRVGGRLLARSRCRFYGIEYEKWEKEFSKEIMIIKLTKND